MNHEAEDSGGAPLITNRTMEMVVALLFIGLSSVFVFDSWRTGFGWIEGQGPGPGFFPFYISLIMGAASLANLIRAASGLEPRCDQGFVSLTALGRVALVLVPTGAYVALIGTIGIYVSSAIFIAGFMLALREHPVRALAIGLGIPAALFLMFEKWFLVPLPKGPLEAMLGY